MFTAIAKSYAAVMANKAITSLFKARYFRSGKYAVIAYLLMSLAPFPVQTSARMPALHIKSDIGLVFNCQGTIF